MAEPTFQEIFGAGATQTATTITILKSDLPMTAAAVNRGEQTFAAIVKKASTKLNPTDFGTMAIGCPCHTLAVVTPGHH